jgi:Bacterial archaeo-eukaryotic release factor family 10
MIDSLSSTTQKLKDLAAARASRGLFLTVTLSTSRLDEWRQFAPTFLRSEFGRITRERSAASKVERHFLQSELDEVLAVLQYDLTPRTQGLALFADGSGGLYQRIELPFRLMNRVVLEPAPYIRPVVHALSLLEPFIVARVSRDESSLYLVDEWGVASEDDLAGPWLRSSDRETGELSIKEYFAAARQDSLVELHYKDVASTLAKRLEVSSVRRVVVCAQHDIANAFRRALPSSVLPRVVAEIPFDAAVTLGQMVVSARTAVGEARRRGLADLVERIEEGLGKAGHGAAGFNEVLVGLQRRQIQIMVVDRNYRPPGWTCPDCDWAGLAHVERCPVCGAVPLAVADAAGELVRLAILQNTRVEVAEEIPALEEIGGVAALLRFA